MTKTFRVEFYDSFQGTCLMDVQAKTTHEAMLLVNELLKRECATEAYELWFNLNSLTWSNDPPVLRECWWVSLCAGVSESEVCSAERGV